MESTDRIALRLADVRKTFGAVQALKGVSLEVRAGEVHALLGENGAGKSTLMAVAAGSLQPDEGVVEIGGERLDAASPSAAQALGLGVVYQHPALADDLSVVENMVLAMPKQLRPKHSDAVAWAQERLQTIGAKVDPVSRVSELTAAETQLVEIAKALALDPSVLILDEPTAALEAEEVEHLFQQVRAIRARGTAIVYISHRIPEVEEIADRLTVLRDGEARGTFGVAEVDEAAILKLIAGRALTAVFPDKLSGPAGATVLSVEGLSGEGFDDVSLEVKEGEIVGVAGVAGNGQRELVRALAGLGHHTGTIEVAGAKMHLRNPRQAQADGIFYIPADRQREGIFPALSVRENAVASALAQFANFGVVAGGSERAALAGQEERLAIKTPSPEADIADLSGGNQQKVAFARAMLGRPRVLICDEPTQGVDVGARVEIYGLLRELAADGCAVVVCSSDALELEGLCDRVAIMSRGQVVATLDSDGVSEEGITAAAVTAGHARKERRREERRSLGWVGRFLRGDGVATPVLAAVIVALAVVTGAQNSDFLTTFNIENLLLLSTALILVGIGQLVVLLTAGVDLSVGPLMGLGLVILTAFATDSGGTGGFFLGLLLAVLAGAAVGLINGGLVQFAKINAVIATLATFIGVQGVALLINPVPTGLFSGEASKTLATAVGGVPVVFIAVVVIGILAELLLRRGRVGLALRAVGSSEPSAHRIGVNVGRTKILAYVVCAVFAALASVMLAVQIGTGDATAGQNYTLQSIAAVVLGGASIYGGRGSFIGTVLGALLLTEMINAITFLELSDAWQYWFPGAVILIAAAIYARVSRIRLAAAAAAETS
jgi:ribose transport system ATP-binding protein